MGFALLDTGFINNFCWEMDPPPTLQDRQWRYSYVVSQDFAKNYFDFFMTSEPKPILLNWKAIA